MSLFSEQLKIKASKPLHDYKWMERAYSTGKLMRLFGGVGLLTGRSFGVTFIGLSNFVIDSRYSREMRGSDLFSGLIRLHILHHAAQEPIFGLGIINELSRHGYRLSPGTLYPLLHAMERRGYLRSSPRQDGRRLRRLYLATPAGRRILKDAKARVRELLGELIENE